MHFIVQNLKLCDKTKKVNQGLKSQTPHIFQMVIHYGGCFTSLDSEHLKMVGWVIFKSQKKTTIGSKCPCNPKTPNLQYLPNPTLLSNNNPTNSFKTLENGGVGHFKTFNTYHN